MKSSRFEHPPGFGAKKRPHYLTNAVLTIGHSYTAQPPYHNSFGAKRRHFSFSATLITDEKVVFTKV